MPGLRELLDALANANATNAIGPNDPAKIAMGIAKSQGADANSSSVTLDRDVLNYIMATKPPTPPKATAPAQAAPAQAPVQAQAAPASVQSVVAQAPVSTAGYTGLAPEATPVGPPYGQTGPALRPMNTAMTPTVTPAPTDFASRVPMLGAGNGGSGVPAAGTGWMPNPNLTAVLGNLSAAIGGPRSVYGQIGGQIAGVAQNKLFDQYINKVMSGAGGGTSGSPFANASFYGLTPDLQAKAAEVGLAMSGAPLTDLLKVSQVDLNQAQAEELRRPKPPAGNRFEDFDYEFNYDKWTGRLTPKRNKPSEPRTETVQEGNQSVTYFVPPGATNKSDFIEIGRGPKWDPSAGAQNNEVAKNRWLQYYKASKAAGWVAAKAKYSEFIQLDPVTGEPVWFALNDTDRQKVLDYANSVYENEMRLFQANDEIPASYHGVESPAIIKARLVPLIENGVQKFHPFYPSVRLFIDPITKTPYPDPSNPAVSQ